LALSTSPLADSTVLCVCAPATGVPKRQARASRIVDVAAASVVVAFVGVSTAAWSVFCLTAGVEMISSTRLKCAENAEKRAKTQSAKQIEETNKAMQAQIKEINKKADETNEKVDILTKGINLQTEQLRTYLSGRD
jgi:peptidoglycan hydrolase CwlO-like protein